MIWLKFTAGGHEYKVTLDRLSIAEAREVKKFTGVTLNSLVMISAGQVDGDVLAAVVFLAKRRAGETIDWVEIDRIDVLELMGTMSVADDEDSAEATGEAVASNGKSPPSRAVKPAPDPEPATTA